MLQELAVQVLELYRDLDKAVAGFACRTGLYCPTGCGHCCFSEKVEATVLECLPLAFELFRTLQAELILKRLEKNGDERQCILYRADYSEAGLWGCTQYPHRAVVCRLFGFAGNPDREGNSRLAMCRVMKNDILQGAVCLDDPDVPMPLFVNAGMRITALHPGMGTRRLPINEALKEALLKVGMLLDFTKPEQHSTSDDPEHPSNNPVLPTSPLGKKAA